MADNNNTRSGLQTAANLAYAAKTAYRIIQAAAASGAYGAAAVAVKEALPFLVKILVGVLVAVIVIPMVIFTALPNIFFGYNSSDTETVIRMTEQAMTIGGAYMSLEDFEKTQIDSVVTSIAAEYEADGKAIDRIVVSNSMKEEDLLWLIAINSAAYQQDLDAMSAECIGNGYVIEAMGTKKGVVKTELESRGWKGWCKLPYAGEKEVPKESGGNIRP